MLIEIDCDKMKLPQVGINGDERRFKNWALGIPVFRGWDEEEPAKETKQGAVLWEERKTGDVVLVVK